MTSRKSEVMIFRLLNGDDVIGMVDSDRINDTKVLILHPLQITQKLSDDSHRYFLELERWLAYTDEIEIVLKQEMIMVYNYPIDTLENYYHQSVIKLFLFISDDVSSNNEQYIQILKDFIPSRDDMN